MVKTYPVAKLFFRCETTAMFIRSYKRKKNGKWHQYFSVVENRRLANDKTVKPTVLYLGEITSSQEDSWRKTLEVFDADSGKTQQKLLFADKAVIAESNIDSIRVKLSGMQLCRPRSFGACRLACELWQKLGLDKFWSQRVDDLRCDISWSKVLKLLAVNRLIQPGSEFYIHRQWFDKNAMDELLNTDYRIASKDRLYRCLDRILEHKQDCRRYLKSRWEDMFGIEFDVLLYDLTSTYFEGLCGQNPKARAAFRCLKSDLAVRPVYHRLENRVEAHIFVAFLAYCLMVTLQQKLRYHAPGLTGRDVLDKLGAIVMIDVRIPTNDGRILEMRRYSQPELEHRIILDKLNVKLPKQPPPKIYSHQLNGQLCGGN